MNSPVATLAALGTALGCALIAGVFFAFSSFVMPALGRLPPSQGISAMQSINVVVLNPWFLGVFMGSALGCLGLGIGSLVRWSQPGAGLCLLGSVLYLVGTILVTGAFNVPRNDAIAAVSADSAEGAALWVRFAPEWTFWNHVRGIAALGASAAFILALLRAASRR